VSSSAQRPRQSRRRSYADSRSRSQRRQQRRPRRPHLRVRPHPRHPAPTASGGMVSGQTVSGQTAGLPGHPFPRPPSRPHVRRSRWLRPPVRRPSPATACRPARPRQRPRCPRLRPCPSSLLLPPLQLRPQRLQPLRLPLFRRRPPQGPRPLRPGPLPLRRAGRLRLRLRLRRGAVPRPGLLRHQGGVRQGRVSEESEEMAVQARGARRSPVARGRRRAACPGRDRGQATTRSARTRPEWAQARTRARGVRPRRGLPVPLNPAARVPGRGSLRVARVLVARVPAVPARLTCRGQAVRGPAR